MPIDIDFEIPVRTWCDVNSHVSGGTVTFYYADPDTGESRAMNQTSSGIIATDYDYKLTQSEISSLIQEAVLIATNFTL